MVNHKLVYLKKDDYICIIISNSNVIMSKPFIYGMSVEGNHFTDRELETKRLKLNFENGVNSMQNGKNVSCEKSHAPDRRC